jgi:amino acid transporter
LNGFFTLATMAVPPVILVYMLVSLGCVRYYLGPLREQFNPLLHLVLPVAGIVLFFFPLYYQFVRYPPVYPEKYGNWVDIAWLVLGIALTLYLVFVRPDRLEDVDKVYVEDETVTPETLPAFIPEA